MGLKRNLENLFAAAAFAENGEFETARQLEANHNVLLVLRGTESDGASLKYALSVSRRMGAGLEVLYFALGGGPGFLKSVEDQARREDVSLKVSNMEGCVKKELVKYTEKRRDIQLVVVESSDELDLECTDRDLVKAWKSINCPLVFVSDAIGA